MGNPNGMAKTVYVDDEREHPSKVMDRRRERRRGKETPWASDRGDGPGDRPAGVWVVWPDGGGDRDRGRGRWRTIIEADGGCTCWRMDRLRIATARG